MILWRLEGAEEGKKQKLKLSTIILLLAFVDIFGDYRLIVNMLLKDEIFK